MEIILSLSGNNSHLSDLERDHPRLFLPRTLDLKHRLLNRLFRKIQIQRQRQVQIRAHLM